MEIEGVTSDLCAGGRMSLLLARTTRQLWQPAISRPLCESELRAAPSSRATRPQRRYRLRWLPSVSDSGVDDGVEDINHEVDGDVERGEEQDQPLDHRVVA